MEYKKPGNVCPRCGSDKINIVAYLNIKCMVCNNCGFDERDNYEVYPEDKVSQKEKGRFSPYKAGGGKRGTK